MRVHKTILCSLSALMILYLPSVGQDAVYVDHVEGQGYPGTIRAGVPIKFHIHFRVVTANVFAVDMAFRIWSPNDIMMEVPYMDTIPGLHKYWPNTVYPDCRPDCDGWRGDTLIFGALAHFTPGLPVGYDSLILTINTKVSETYLGDTICLDSIWWDPSFWWEWVVNSPIWVIHPTWDGPHCFEIVPCCVGWRGNIDLDPNEQINIADLTYLIQWLFLGGPEPLCMLEADVNANGGTIGMPDLVYLVDYMFRGGPPPMGCP
ncbi:MAG TPA: hypothetical protein VN285_04120 [Candidatus Deferrimicrobium sp.]|nr:hypothetical protein [Candidatus Deferrimicrobium sp.]